MKKPISFQVVLADTEDVWGRFLPPRANNTVRRHWFCLRTWCSPPAVPTARRPARFTARLTKTSILIWAFQELARLGAPGDFARAYVLGHEIGHHIQNLLGTEAQVRQARSRASQAQANAPLSVRLSCKPIAMPECGPIAHQQRQVLEQGDIEEGLTAASAIGDDRFAASGRSAGKSGFLHPRQFRATGGMVPSGPADWQRARVRNTFATANG